MTRIVWHRSKQRLSTGRGGRVRAPSARPAAQRVLNQVPYKSAIEMFFLARCVLHVCKQALEVLQEGVSRASRYTLEVIKTQLLHEAEEHPSFSVADMLT